MARIQISNDPSGRIKVEDAIHAAMATAYEMDALIS